MRKHLSARQIDECILGLPDLEAEDHLRSCARCQTEVTGVRDALGNFRQSVHDWSDEQLAARTEPGLYGKPTPSWMSMPRLSWAIVAAVVCLLIAVMAPWRQASAPGVTDAALLSQIDAEVSRTVPGPMEPLTEFVSNDSSTAKKEARP